MKRASFACLFLGLTTTLLWSQANPVPLINQTASVASPTVVSSGVASPDVVASSVVSPSPIKASQADPKAQARILDGYGKLPLSFEANQGQADARVKFLSRTGGYTLFLTVDEAVLALWGKKKSSPQGLKPASLAGSRGTAEPAAGLQSFVSQSFVSGHRFSDAASSEKSEAPLGAARRDRPTTEAATAAVLRMKLRHANRAAKVTGADELTGTSNYFIGNDPAKWRTNVPTYAKVKYEGIYPGIDLVYYGNQRQLEYDFIVAPGADPRRIAFDVRGAKRIRRDARGDLVLKMSEGEIRWHKPLVYQEKNGTRQEIAAHYAITETNRVGFEVAKYDLSQPLYIDPLIYSTYLGGSSFDAAFGIAVDSADNAYVTGFTTSIDFPVTPGAFQKTCCGAFVTKVNPTGSALVYSTYLGGSGGDDGFGIAVDSSGNAYVTGDTHSTDFPVTPGAFQTTCGNPISCENAFVTEINPTGSALVYSTYLGGSGNNDSKGDKGLGIAVDSGGNAYVTGRTHSKDFPTENPLQKYGGEGDAFVSKLNPEGSALVYSTYLGGSGNDAGFGIAVDNSGNACVTGISAHLGQPYAFVTKLNPTGSALVYSNNPGGSYGYGISVDSVGNAYVTGLTRNGAQEAFVTKLDPTGAFVYYNTLRGGFGYGIAVDSAGNAHVTGSVGLSKFPTTPGAFQTTYGGGGDAFVTKFDPTGSALVYSTYLGGSGVDIGFGIAVDNAGNAYVTGGTQSSNFPITPGAFQTSYGGGNDAFVTKMHMPVAASATALTSSPNPSTYRQQVTFTAVVTSSLGAPPDGETVTFMKGTKVWVTEPLSGGTATFTPSTLKVGTTTVTAVYAGDSNLGGSMSPAVSQVVNKATTTTTLVSSQNPSNFGQAVTFTASVVPQFGGTVTGTVTFYDGTTALTTVSLSKDVAKFTTSTLARGTHTITATYNGSTNFIGSSASLTQTVN